MRSEQLFGSQLWELGSQPISTRINKSNASKNPNYLVRLQPFKGPYVKKRPTTGYKTWFRPRNRRKGAWVPPNYRKNVQGLGNGGTARWIEQSYAASSNSGIVSLSTALSQSTEFASLATHYRYMRINKINLTIYPKSDTLITRWLMKWTDDGGNAGIDYDDSTKIIQTHAIKNQYLKWKPINATLPTNKAGGLVTMNPAEWVVIDDLYANNVYYLPGTILYTIENLAQNVQLNFRLAIHVTLRGSKVPNPAKLLEIAGKLQKQKQPEFKETQPINHD